MQAGQLINSGCGDIYIYREGQSRFVAGLFVERFQRGVPGSTAFHVEYVDQTHLPNLPEYGG